jgi:carboxymethylenebutenolidase
MNVRIPSSQGGDFAGYLAIPRAGRGPGVVVLQEIFGVNESMRKVCDFLASRQFTALAPDLYWRTDPGVELAETDVERARAIRMKTDDDKASDDAADAMAFLSKHAACTGRVGVVGYCWGGLISYLTAVRHKPLVAASYYGVGIDKRLDLAKNLACPLMLHYAGLDQYAGPDVAQKVRETFKSNPHVIVHEYAKAGHAFARPEGAHYHHASADLANNRTLSFFVEHLFGNW